MELVTLDPAGSTDLDQAFALHRDGDGFVLHYAIADVAAHVIPGGAIDRVAHARGQTLYAPDGREGLHAPALSEDAGSLLAGVGRLAVLWTLTIDDRGELAGTAVARAVVLSTAQLHYAGAQVALNSGGAHEQLMLLRGRGHTPADRAAPPSSYPNPRRNSCPTAPTGGRCRESRSATSYRRSTARTPPTSPSSTSAAACCAARARRDGPGVRAGGRLAGNLHRACIDLSEAVLLQHRVGDRFLAAVVDVDDRGADPARRRLRFAASR